jgi:hypothetical protein
MGGREGFMAIGQKYEELIAKPGQGETMNRYIEVEIQRGGLL